MLSLCPQSCGTIEKFKVFFKNQAFKTLFFGLFRLNLGLVFRWDNLFTFNYELGHLVCEELYELSFDKKSFLDESFDDHVNLNKTRVFSLDYVLRDLEMDGDGLEAEDDVRNLELVVAMEKYLRF